MNATTARLPANRVHGQSDSARNSNGAIHRWGTLLPAPCHREGRSGAVGNCGSRPEKNRQVSLKQRHRNELHPVQFAQGAHAVQQRRMLARGTIVTGVRPALIVSVMRTDMLLQRVRRLRTGDRNRCAGIDLVMMAVVVPVKRGEAPGEQPVHQQQPRKYPPFPHDSDHSGLRNTAGSHKNSRLEYATAAG